jgi:multidrug resistance efflux pump
LSENNNLELRSDEVQEILGTPPQWIVRWGITVIFIVIIVLLAGSYFYRYPDIIPSRVTVIPENPPVSIVSKINGKIDTLFVVDKQIVGPGELLGIIENPANFTDVYNLIRELDSIKGYFDLPDKISEIRCNEGYSLGEFQTYFSSFVGRIKEYNTFLGFNPVGQRIQTLRKQVNDYRNYYQKMLEQADVLKEDYELKEKQYLRDSMLHVRNVISDMDYENSKASLLKQKYSYRNSLTDMVNINITINNLNQQIQELEVTNAETGKKLQSSLKEHYDNLVNQLKTWEQIYVLKSPIAGKITFNNIWAKNQYVPAGSVVFSVVPVDSQKVIGKALVPVSGAGKVEVGQRVNIKLDNFPYMEYGFLEGRITTLSSVTVNVNGESFYTAEVSLPPGLITNYRKVLPSGQEMLGTAEIITRDRRLIERIVAPLVSIFRERMLTD